MDNKVLWINIDGMRRDFCHEMLDSGALPNLCELFSSGLRVERAVSIFPSVTLACQSSLFTGCHPARHNLYGNGWFDRFSNPPVYRDYTNMHAALHIYGFKLWGWPTILLARRKGPPLANTEINHDIPTIYETLQSAGMTSAVVFNHISRGATQWVTPSRRDMINFALCHEDYTEFDRFERATAKRAVHTIRKFQTFPDLLSVYMSAFDGYSHVHGVDAMQDYSKRHLDPALGRILKAVRARSDTQNLRYMLTVDHGHASVKPDKNFAVLNQDVEKMVLQLKRVPYHLECDTPLEDSNVIILNQGGSMHLYIKDPRSNSWKEMPPMEALMEFADEMNTLSQSPFERIGAGWLSLILLKDPESNKYSVWQDGSLVGIEEYFKDKDDLYPDAVERLNGFASPSSPDVVFLSNYDDGYYFADKPHGGQHGHLHWQDSLVPLIISGHGIQKGTIKNASIVDAAPTAAALLGLDMPKADGKSLLPQD